MRRLWLFPLTLLFALPALLAADEAMTPEIVVSAEDCDERDPQAAYNSLHDEFLVVWNDVCSSATPVARILARRLNRYGLPIGATFEVSPTADGRNRSRASIAHDPINDRYLVVYTLDYWNDGSDFDIRGRFVDWDGVEPAWEEFVIASSSDSEWNPEVAFSSAGEKFLVAFSKDDATSGLVVWGALFAFGAVPVPLPIASPAYRIAPDVAYDATLDRFAVVYDDSNDAFVRVIDAASGTVHAETTVANVAPDESLVSAASCGHELHLAAWKWRYAAGDTDLSARLLDGGGAGAGPILEVSGGAGLEQFVELDCLDDGSEYLLAFEFQYNTGDFGIGGRRVDEAGAIRTWFYLRGLSGDETGMTYHPAVAGGRTGWLVAWEHLRQSPEPNYLDIHARVVWNLFADGFEWGETGNWSSTVP